MSVPVTTLDEFRRHLAPVVTGRVGPDAGEIGPAEIMAFIAALGG